MTQRVQIPRFGNWEGEANIPYTVCFDKAFKGHYRGEAIRQSSHKDSPEKKLYNDASPARAVRRSGKEKPTEKQQHLEMPKFGDWGCQGDDVPYTIYFERVSKRSGRGKTVRENDGHCIKSAEYAHRPSRRELVQEKSPENQKSNKSGVIVLEDFKQESKNKHQGNSAASLKGHNKKILTGGSSDSKHCADGSALLPLPHYETRPGAIIKGHPVSQRRSPDQRKFDISGESSLRTNTSRNEEVVLGTAVPKYPSSSDGLSQISNKVLEHKKEPNQSASDNDSSYINSKTKIKEEKANTCCFPWGRK